MLTKAPKLVLSKDDYKKLSALVASQKPESVAVLEEEIGRALVLSEGDLPEDVVSMNSFVRVRDLDSGTEYEYRLVYPHEANASEGRISILAPLGAALIGLQVNEEYEYLSPNEKYRRFQVLSIFSPKPAETGKGA